MALAYIYHANFESAALGTEWDTETDTAAKLSRIHYSEAARIPGAPAPYRGAYMAMWDLTSGTTSDATLTEGDCNIADGATAYYMMYVYVSKDFTATADDTFNFLELQDTSNVRESSLGFRVTAASNLLEIGIGDGTAPTSFVQFPRGKWVCVELLATISTSDAGVLTLFLDGTQVATLTSLDNGGAVTHAVLGTQDTLATTTGRIFVSEFINDDARIYPLNPRFPQDVLLTKSGHVFVGEGMVDNVSLLSGAGTDCVVTVYDTDVAYTDGYNQKLELKNTANNELVDPAGVPVKLQRGCYVTLAGTTPRAIVKICSAQGYWSDGRIKQHGANRTPAPGNW